MGKFDNIAILTDLDRTFLDDGAKMVERNVEAIEYFKSEGGLFSLATGRMHYNLERTVVGVDKLVNAPAVMCNGTYLYDFQTQKVFDETYMNAELACEALKFIRNISKSTCMRGSYTGGYAVIEGDTYAENDLRSRNIDCISIFPLEKWKKLDLYKLVFLDEPQRVDCVESALRKRFPSVFEYNRSAAHALELQMSGVNKSRLLPNFRKYYSAAGRELTLYACGDNENDIEMLKKADAAVCPSNAIDRVKAICDKCLCSNNEGLIAELICSL